MQRRITFVSRRCLREDAAPGCARGDDAACSRDGTCCCDDGDGSSGSGSGGGGEGGDVESGEAVRRPSGVHAHGARAWGGVTVLLRNEADVDVDVGDGLVVERASLVGSDQSNALTL